MAMCLSIVTGCEKVGVMKVAVCGKGGVLMHGMEGGVDDGVVEPCLRALG